MEWNIRQKGFEREKIPALGNRFLCGNGYLGIRGTLEEYGKDEMAAINLAGIFDLAAGGWREPLNAPNGLYTCLSVDGVLCALPETEPGEHEMTLDFRHGIFGRETSWNTEGGSVTVRSERFASAAEIHLIALRYTVTVDHEADITIVTGIDGDVWDIHGPHYDRLESGGEDAAGMDDAVHEAVIPDMDGAAHEAVMNEVILRMDATTHEKGDVVTVMEAARLRKNDGAWGFAEEQTVTPQKKILRKYSFRAEPGAEYHLEKGIVTYTSQDDGWDRKQALELLEKYRADGFEGSRKAHEQCWEEKWSVSEVEIDGDDAAAMALNYSIYHLLSIAPTHGDHMSIPARGLSGQTYKGAVFWDTEMFMLDFFLFTDPKVARSLMKYRTDTLGGALEKAASYGYEGAFYAWESQEGGYDACTDYNVVDVFTGRPQRTYFRDKQYHISAAVVYGLMRYQEITGDESLLYEGGFETIVECAKFYYSLLLKRAVKDCYEIHDVIGPDEYHERVNNNGYTNRMAKLTLESAASLLERFERGELGSAEWQSDQSRKYPIRELAGKFRDAAEKMYLQQPGEDGIIRQFDGYEKLEDVTLGEVRKRLLHEKEYWGGAYGVAAETKVIKQADVVTMLNLFSGEYEPEVLKENWEYYEPRTEHGSSLSSCMYAMLACKCSMPDRAYPFFMNSASADLRDGGKEWAGLIYIGGTHPAASGGAYMTAVEGFGGITVKDGVIHGKPSLPEGWKKMRFCICCRGGRYEVTVREKDMEIHKI